MIRLAQSCGVNESTRAAAAEAELLEALEAPPAPPLSGRFRSMEGRGETLGFEKGTAIKRETCVINYVYFKSGKTLMVYTNIKSSWNFAWPELFQIIDDPF